MTAYVFTIFSAFGAERVLFVSKDKKVGEKQLRKMYPHMCADTEHSYILNKKPEPLFGGVHEVDLYGWKGEQCRTK